MGRRHLLAIALLAGLAASSTAEVVPMQIDNGVPSFKKPATGNARIRRQAKAAKKARNKNRKK